MNQVKYLCHILLVLMLAACSDTSHKLKQYPKTYVVHMAAIHKSLYFTGTIQPLHEQSISSPIDAVVNIMQHNYGEFIKKNEGLFVLDSTELQKQYNDTLTEYLKAKDNFTVANAKFIGTKDLWQAGLLSKNNYLSEKSSLNTSRVTLMQITRKLAEMFAKMGEGSDEDLSSLSFAEFNKVKLALNGKHNLIHLKAPSDGVLLYPPKANNDKSARISVGAAIKAGQVLALVGDLSGIRVEIDVPELDIDKIKVGMTASLHGVAFGQRELKGRLVAVNAQASAGANGNLPSFTAAVEVQGLNKAEREWIKVGMSASIGLMIASVDKLSVPIAALLQKDGKNAVRVRRANGLVSTVGVMTGAVHGNLVVVELGLKAGDVVIYD